MSKWTKLCRFITAPLRLGFYCTNISTLQPLRLWFLFLNSSPSTLFIYMYLFDFTQSDTAASILGVAILLIDGKVCQISLCLSNEQNAFMDFVVFWSILPLRSQRKYKRLSTPVEHLQRNLAREIVLWAKRVWCYTKQHELQVYWRSCCN